MCMPQDCNDCNTPVFLGDDCEWPENGVIRCWDCQQRLIEGVLDDVRQLCDVMAFDWDAAPETLRRDSHDTVRSSLIALDRQLSGMPL